MVWYICLNVTVVAEISSFPVLVIFSIQGSRTDANQAKPYATLEQR
jgi:hypothetical protein